MPRTKIVLLICVSLAGCVTPKYDSYIDHHQVKKLSEKVHLSVEIIPTDKIAIRGVFNSDNSLNTGSMMYSANAGAIGVVAQIFTQAAITQSAREGKRRAQQEKADEVLSPFSELLSHFSAQAIKHTSNLYSFDTPNTGKGTWILTSQPIFYLSQDSRQLSIKHLVAVRSATNPGADPIFSNRVEVFGPVIPAKNIVENLRSNSKYGFRQQLKLLYRQSLILAVKDLYGTLSRKGHHYQTFTINSGSKIQFERGQLLSQTCDLTVIRNLRGWIMAFPPQTVSDTCGLPGSTELTGQIQAIIK